MEGGVMEDGDGVGELGWECSGRVIEDGVG